MKKHLRTFLKFLVFFSVGLGILYLVYRDQEAAYQEHCTLKDIPQEECSLIGKVLTDFSNANYYWILLVLLLFMISNLSRAIRMKMLIEPLGYQPKLRNCFGAVIIGYFANLGIPRMGEVVKAGVLAQYEKIGVEKVMGTVVVDRIVDVISILLVTALSLILAFDQIWPFFSRNLNIGDRLSGANQWLFILLGFGVAGITVLWLFRKRILNSKLGRKVYGLLIGFWDGLRTVGRLRQPGWFLLHSINIWLMYFLMIYVCFFAFEPTAHLSPIAGLVVFVFGGWGMVVPTPGGMGTYHFMVQTALQIFGVDINDGFSFANIAFFSISVGCNVVFGLIAVSLLPWLNRNYHPAPKIR